MAEKINLAEFSIDVEALTNAAAQTQKAIQEIRNEQKQLVKDGKGADEAFVRNAVNLRGLQKDYNAQLRVLDRYINTSGKQIPIQQQIDAALQRETSSIRDLREQNKQLTAIRNEVNIETEEGQQQLAQLNAQLDINNNLIKENVSDLEQQKIGIGGYADGIQEALQGTGLFGSALNDVNGAIKSFEPLISGLRSDLSSATESFKNVTAGTEGMTAAQKAATVATNVTSASLKALRLALIATGIGAIVVLLGSLVAYLNSSEQASNRLGRVLGALGGIVSRLLDYLEPLGEFIVDVLIAGFERLGRIATQTLESIATGLDALGFTGAARDILKFSDSMSQAARNADRLTQMQQKLTEEERKAGIIRLQYQRDAERLRQIRDDENRTIADRIEANENLGKVLQEQLRSEQQIANQALAIANLRIAQDGRTAANLDAQAEAMERILDIQERITGQESEQLTNRVQLQRDAATQSQEAAQARIDALNEELALYQAQQSVRAKTLEEEIALEQDFADRRRAILGEELRAKLISQTAYDTALQELENEAAERQAQLANDNLQRELSNIEGRIEVERAVSDAVGEARIKLEEEQFRRLQAARADLEAQRFEQGITNEQEYVDAVAAIRQQGEIREAQFAKERRDLEQQRKEEQLELDLEQQMIALETLNASEWEIRELQNEQNRELRLEEARRRYTDAAQLAQAELNINQQADNAALMLEQEKNRAIWNSRSELAGALAQIFGEETAIGKAAGVAQATINAYVGMTEALKLPFPFNLAAAATTLATGLNSVRSISGTGTDVGTLEMPSYSPDGGGQAQQAYTLNAVAPFATGGKVKKGMGYPIRRSNGDNILSTLKTGEVVLNERQQAALGGHSVFKAIGVPGFATGGLVGSGSATVQSALFAGIENQLADAIGDAVQKGARIGTEIGSKQGISDLSTENYLRNLASM